MVDRCADSVCGAIRITTGSAIPQGSIWSTSTDPAVVLSPDCRIAGSVGLARRRCYESAPVSFNFRGGLRLSRGRPARAVSRRRPLRRRGVTGSAPCTPPPCGRSRRKMPVKAEVRWVDDSCFSTPAASACTCGWPRSTTATPSGCSGLMDDSRGSAPQPFL